MRQQLRIFRTGGGGAAAPLPKQRPAIPISLRRARGGTVKFITTPRPKRLSGFEAQRRSSSSLECSSSTMMARLLVLACTLFGGHAAPTAFPTYADASADCRHTDTPWLGKMSGDKTSLLLIQQDVNQYISFIPTINPMPPAALGELAGHKALGGYQKAKDRITFQLRALDTMSESGQPS